MKYHYTQIRVEIIRFEQITERKNWTDGQTDVKTVLGLFVNI